MAQRELSVRIGVNTGSADSKLKALNTNIKASESAFKNAGAGVKDFEKTTDGIKVKLEHLGDQFKIQGQRVDVLKKAISDTKVTLDESNKAYETQKDKVAGLSKALETAEKNYGKNSKEVKALAKELKTGESALKLKERAVISVDQKLTGLESSLNNTEADMKKLKSQIDDTNKSLNNMNFENVGKNLSEVGNNVKNVGDTVSGFGSKMMLGITAPILAMATLGVESFSNIGESLNVLQSIYGDSTDQMVGYNQKLVKSHGLSEEAYYSSMSSYGAMLQDNSRLTKSELADLTSTLVKRSSDLSSFFNANQDKVQEDLKSILKGSYEVADNYGVMMNVDILEGYASSVGKVWKELDNEEKSLMSVEYFLKKTQIASGDFEDTNKSWANSLRVLQASLKNLSKVFGEVLLPIIEPLLSKFSDFVARLSEASESTKRITVFMLLLAGAIAPVLIIAGTLISSIGSIMGAFGTLSTAIASAGGLGAFFTASILPVIGVIVGVIAVVILLVGAIKSNFEGIKEAFVNLKQSFNDNLEPMKASFENVWLTMQDMYNIIIVPLFTSIGEIIQIVIQFIADIMPGISTAFQIVCDVLTTVWESVGKPVFQFIMEIVGIVVEWFKQYMPKIAEVFNSVMDTLKFVWENVGKPLFGIIEVIIGAMIEVLKPIIVSLMDVFGRTFEAIKSVWDNVLKPVIEVISTVIGGMIDLVSPHMDTFKSVIAGAMEFVLSPIQNAIDKFGDLMDFIAGAGEDVGGFLSWINPFKSIDMGINLNASGVTNLGGFQDIALSGQVYNARTPMAQDVNSMISGEVKVNDNSVDILETMKNQNKILMQMLELLVAGKEIIVQSDVVVDGRAIAKSTAKFMEREIKTINGRAGRISGLAY